MLDRLWVRATGALGRGNGWPTLAQMYAASLEIADHDRQAALDLLGFAADFHGLRFPPTLPRRLPMPRFLRSLAHSLPLAAIPFVGAHAQLDLSGARPGRDPKQLIDSAYTAKILEYTTEKFFLSPLVDYLPASKSVPTPKAVLGDIAGAPTKLPYSKEVYEYMRLLTKSTPRVKVI